jgi:hypothetical protein
VLNGKYLIKFLKIVSPHGLFLPNPRRRAAALRPSHARRSASVASRQGHRPSRARWPCYLAYRAAWFLAPLLLSRAPLTTDHPLPVAPPLDKAAVLRPPCSDKRQLSKPRPDRLDLPDNLPELPNRRLPACVLARPWAARAGAFPRV